MSKKYSMFIFLVWLGVACKETPEPDPCEGLKPVSADFTIHETPFAWHAEEWKVYDTDTIATYGATFTATEKNAEYEWTIGSEKIYTRSFYRKEFPLDTPVPITLKVKKKPNSACFPNDDGEDVKTRNLVFVDVLKAKFWGDFEGSNIDEPNRKFTVSFLLGYFDVNNPSEIILRITNLKDEGCKIDYRNGLDVEKGYKQLFFDWHYNFACYQPIGTAKVHGINNDSITIDYNITRFPKSSSWQDRINKTFKGKRKN